MVTRKRNQQTQELAEINKIARRPGMISEQLNSGRDGNLGKQEAGQKSEAAIMNASVFGQDWD